MLPTYYFSGRVYNAAHNRSDTTGSQSFGFFALTDGRVRGTIHTGDKIYQIESLDANTVSIVQTDWTETGNIDEGALIPDRDVRGAQQREASREMLFASQQAVAASGSVTPTEVDIVVVYTTKALQRAVAAGQDYVGQAAFSVYYTNQIYQNSSINARLRLVGVGTTNLTESSNMESDLYRITLPYIQNHNPDVLNLRNQLRADLAILVADYNGNNSTTGLGTTNGIAFKSIDQHEQISGPITYLPEYAFGVVDYDFMGKAVSTFPHEVGHIYGADHNPENDNSPNSGFYYGHGKRKNNNFCPDFICGQEWQTVMSYGNSTQIPYFSTPSLTWGGNAIGSTTQNNVLVHNNTAYAVSLFRTPPAPPLSVDVQGPSTATAGSTVTYTAVVSAGQTSVQYVWRLRTADMNEDEPGTIVQTGGSTYTMLFTAPGFVSAEVTNAQGEVAQDGIYTALPYINPCPKPTLPGCEILDDDMLSDTDVAVNQPMRVVYATGRLQVWLGLETSISAEIAVYDLLGRQVIARQASPDAASFALALPPLPAGTYLVVVRSAGTHTFTKTFVVR